MTQPDPTAAIEVFARLLCAADAHVYGDEHPTWQQLSTTEGRRVQDDYRKAARWLLPRMTVGRPAAVSAVVPPADQAALRDRIARSIRDAACAGDCGLTDEECAKERIQPFVWHHGRLAVVEGTPEQFADAVLAVLPEPADRAVLRDRIADAIARVDSGSWGTEIETMHPYWRKVYRAYADAVLAVLPEPADRAIGEAVVATEDCPHCPDGHTPPDRGSQPWSAWVSSERDGDGQPMQITVARSAGAHVAESDAQWVRERLNAPTTYADHLPLDHPLRRECRCSEAGVCRRCAERASAAGARQDGAQTEADRD